METQNIGQLALGWLREKSGLLQGTTTCCATGTCNCRPEAIAGQVPIASEVKTQFVAFS